MTVLSWYSTCAMCPIRTYLIWLSLPVVVGLCKSMNSTVHLHIFTCIACTLLNTNWTYVFGIIRLQYSRWYITYWKLTENSIHGGDSISPGVASVDVFYKFMEKLSSLSSRTHKGKELFLWILSQVLLYICIFMIIQYCSFDFCRNVCS